MNIHLGSCGACGGNVTRSGNALPRCEQCGAEPIHGPVLPMRAQPEEPLERNTKTGRFQRPK